MGHDAEAIVGRPNEFRCRICGFLGGIREAIAHVVANQWTYRSA